MSQSFFKPRKNFSKSRGRPHSANHRFRNQAQNYTYDQKNIGIDNTVKEKIIEILKRAFPDDIHVKVLFNKFPVKYSKSTINQVLYQLQDENIVKKTSESPPKWAIVRNQNSETHSHEKQAHITFMKQKEISDVPANSKTDNEDFSDLPALADKDISNAPNSSSISPIPDEMDCGLEHFKATPSTSSTVSNNDLQFADDSLTKKLLVVLHTLKECPISKLVQDFKGSYSKKQLNQTLYSLQQKGYVSRSTENPPKWGLLLKGYDLFDSAFEKPTHSLGKRQDPADCIGKLQAVSISSDKTEKPYAPPCKIPRMSSGHFFKDDIRSSDKNPISQLMEYAQANSLKPDFQTSQSGPDHKRRFSVVVTLGDQTYPPVEGSSKKEAKTAACEQVLRILQQSSEKTLPPSFSSLSAQNRVPQQASFVPQQLQHTAISSFSINVGNSNKNAISFINEYAQANSLPIEFNHDSCGPDHRKRTILKLGNQVFQPVFAPSKKESKLKAAEAALLILQESGKVARTSPGSTEGGGRREIKTYHDRVALLVNDKFHNLLGDLPDTVVGRKILAGFVMSRTFCTEHGEEKQWSVVSIGSGNRCVAGDKLSMKGDTVYDCHAEVIARRGLMRFFYDQIDSYQADAEDEDNILQPSKQDPSRFEMKPGVRFHLYISTAPCGDSALFAKNDLDGDVIYDLTGDSHHPLFDNKKQGILRTKVENGEGCIPIDEDANVPTWDGLLRGERLRTMSCSDKLAKWNLLGLQGSLLSHFIEPVYMSSLTLGMLFHHGHLTRAVCCRVKKYLDVLAPTDLPPQFSVNHPEVAKVSGDDPSRDTGKVKTREYSLNWSYGDERAEVLDGTRGRCEPRFGSVHPVSQVSKLSLYTLFQKVSKTPYSSYVKAKEAMTEYRTASNIMKKAFEKADCGTWMEKPSEVDDF